MWNISTVFWLFAVITLIVSVVLILQLYVQNLEFNSHETRHNRSRAQLFILLTIALVLIAIYFQHSEHHAHGNMLPIHYIP